MWVIRDGRAERRAIKLGAVRGDETAIDAGLSGGDRIVIDGVDQLSEGTRVTEKKR